MDERGIEEEARAIVKESIEMGNRGAETGGECVKRGDEAVWKSAVSGERYCEEHAKEHFQERHG